MSPFVVHFRHRARPAASALLIVIATFFSWTCDVTGPPRAQTNEPITVRKAAIVRGEPATEGLPALAAIILREGNDDEELLAVICSGTLIAPRVVLTAAHCIDRHGPERAPVGHERSWFVSFEADLTGLGRDNLDLPGDAIEVNRTRVHPGFSQLENTRVGLGPSHDLGLVFLSAPVTDRAPSALVSPQAAPGLVPGATVIVAGYGARSAEGAAAPESGTGLKSAGAAQVLEVGSHELRVGRPDHPASPDEQSLADKCSGDSGGPTFLNLGEEPFLVGLSSRGYDGNPRCDSASIDLRIEIFVPWILEQVATEGAHESIAAAPGCSAAGAGASPAGALGPGLLIVALLCLAVARDRLLQTPYISPSLSPPGLAGTRSFRPVPGLVAKERPVVVGYRAIRVRDTVSPGAFVRTEEASPALLTTAWIE